MLDGAVGFGGYRITLRSDEHRKALDLAIKKGVTFIETSSNYSNGESELLIGEVLRSNPLLKRPTLISKVGYIQGDNLDLFNKKTEEGHLFEDVVHVSPDLKHSIHPDFIEDQIKGSLERLKVRSLDSYLLHNPEYYLKEEDSSKDVFYKRIMKAFLKMEELVDRGLIKSYGVSSNTFINPRDDLDSIDLDRLFRIALEIESELGRAHNLKIVQFPFNLLEMGALEKQYGGENLIERAKGLGLKVIINRPLNSFSDHGLVRFANYDVADVYKSEANADAIFNKSLESLVIKWLEVREDEGDKLFDIPVMQQVQKIWCKQKSQDAVGQVFMQYFFPLIANIWGRDMTPEESAPFYELYEHAIEFAKNNMNERAQQFEEQAIDKGLLFESNLTLSQKAIDKYLSMGVEHILVGMRSESYVEDLSRFFKV